MGERNEREMISQIGRNRRYIELKDFIREASRALAKLDADRLSAAASLSMVGGSFTTIDGTGRNYLARLNPNGSLENIAGICNEAGTVAGLMPHPERASESILGSEDGRLIFESLLSWLKNKTAKAA